MIIIIRELHWKIIFHPRGDTAHSRVLSIHSCKQNIIFNGYIAWLPKINVNTRLDADKITLSTLAVMRVFDIFASTMMRVLKRVHINVRKKINFSSRKNLNILRLSMTFLLPNFHFERA